MKNRLRGFVGVVLLLAAGIRAPAQPNDSLRPLVGQSRSATVTSVVDGDTVHVRLEGGREIIVRLDGIDTPERDEPFYAQARNAARVLLFDKRVTVTGTDVDRYERLVARVMVGGADASVELVKVGLACRYAVYSKDPAIAAAQTEAKRTGRGFWAAGLAPPPCAAGSASPVARAAPLGPFRGNTQSHLYHAPSCDNYRCRNCTVTFQSEADAQRAGFTPAGDCLRREAPIP